MISKENKDLKNNTRKNIESMGSPTIATVPKDIFFVSIIGEIEGHNASPPNKKTTKYEHIIPQLLSAERDPKVKGILILLNTVGGDIEAGLALSEMINSMSKPTVSLVLGGGHSIGVPLATSADYSFIAPTASMTLHPIRMNGLVIGVPQTFRYFQKMQQRIFDFILRTSKITEDKLKDLMYDTDEIANDVGTVLIGKETVEVGVIDEVGGLKESINKLQELFNE